MLLLCLTECGTWTTKEDRAALGGMEYPYSSLSECLNKCLEMSGCVAVDVSMVVCFVHTDFTDLESRTFPSLGFKQYTLHNRTCPLPSTLSTSSTTTTYSSAASQASTVSTYLGKWHNSYTYSFENVR